MAQHGKHALGLMMAPFRDDVTLLYLFWQPLNHAAFPEFQSHRDEVACLQQMMSGARPLFKSATYGELLEDWRSGCNEEWLRAHVDRLQQRYAVVIPPEVQNEV
ncbi:MAG: hypothetical protein IPP47_14355 [Bryobacterales bacterium]|nr:hypothetical protein [Bryobacterales bacterium]